MTTAKTAPATAPTKKPRDLRLDFFRGLGMYIIFVAHMPENSWNSWIPARFGASDATEIFVFCSGMASAIAFGAVFRDRSWWLGTARAAFRVWQVYWAHIALFFVTVSILVVLDGIEGSGTFYTERLYVRPFFEDTAGHLVALMTLHYVPNYFDILPMYLVLLAMMPVFAGIGMWNRWVAFALMFASWFACQFGLLSLPAEIRPDAQREWFFNPFAWQLVFFTGFSLMMGWIKAPPFRWWLVWLAIGVLVFNFFVASRWSWQIHQVIYDFRDATWQNLDKTDLGLYRYTHFLALAYLAYVAAGEGGRRLAGTGLWAAFVRVVRKVGQQSLAVFLASMVLAQLCGALLDVTGRNVLTVALVNLGGFVVLTGIAYGTGWFKSQPWRRTPQPVDGVRADRRQTEALAMQPSGTGA